MNLSKLLFLSCVSLAAVAAQFEASYSQATLDRVLASVNIAGSADCSSIDVRLNRAASYRHHFPKQSGTSVDVSIELLGTEAGEPISEIEKEAASVSPGNPAGLEGVSFSLSDSKLHLTFSHEVNFRVVMDNNTRHVRVDVAGPNASKTCLGLSESEGSENPKSDVAAKTDGPPVGNDAASALKEGKALLAAKDYARATAYFTKAVEIGGGSTKRDAQEMLGLSREKAGQLVHAKAEYQSYLKQYPQGPGSARVRSRLTGLLAAMDGAAQAQFNELKAKRVPQQTQANSDSSASQIRQPMVAEGKGDVLPPGDSQGGGGLLITKDGMILDRKEAEVDPNAWTWEHTGSLAQYYYRNDSLRSTDPTTNNYGLHEVFQNEVLTSADGRLHGENQFYEIELRSSLFNEKGFATQSDINSTNIGSLYVDARMKENGLSAKLGRQSKSTGGAFGRFDGALLGWEIDDDIKLQAYAGSPVYRRDAKPFEDDRRFLGASVDYSFPGDRWATALYAIAQDAGSIIDRRALGAELRYNSKELSIYSAGDYDVFYGELNNGYLNVNWRAREGTNIYGTVDFRRVPFLVTSNALMGQVEDDLQSLVEIFGEDGVYELAVDRTATAKTASLGFSQEIVQDWQITIDAMVADYSGTPASGGVDAIPDPGIEYYLSSQLSGANVFKENDSLNIGLRYSGSDSNNFYMADASYRFMVNEDWRLSPRLRLSMRDSKTSDQEQYVVSTSIASRYKLNKNWSFETEFGVRWEDVVTTLSDTRSLDVLLTAGYRYEF